VCRCSRLFTDPIKTLRAPSGVTRIGGAKAYAAKLATSPITTGWCEQVARGVEDGRRRTCDDAGPPNGTLEICEAFSFKTMLLTGLHQAFFRNDKTRSLYSLVVGFAGLEVGRITYRKCRGDGQCQSDIPEAVSVTWLQWTDVRHRTCLRPWLVCCVCA
jgi:hypothetical protein